MEKLALDKSESWKTFEAIANKYDLINSVLSLGMHKRWKKDLIGFLPKKKSIRALDIATGTGDIALMLAKERFIESIDCVYLSPKMLAVAEKKIKKSRLNIEISLQHYDAAALPFAEKTFDVVTCAFGIRNMPNIERVLNEIKRVLKPKGKIFILEFSHPSNRMVKYFSLSYMRGLLPWTGKLLSGHETAYSYLTKSTEDFLNEKEFVSLLKKCHYKYPVANRMTFGLVTIYSAES